MNSNFERPRKKNNTKPVVLAPFVKNAGWFYYRYYYRELGSRAACNFDELNKSLIRYRLPDYVAHTPSSSGGYFGFTLKTTYPGLLIGTGTSHETGSGSKGEFKLGLSFDYTSGLPVIPGASLKGLLRSVFPNSIRKKKEEAEEKQLEETFRAPRRQYIREKLEEIGVCDVDVDALENEIFEGIDSGKENIPVYSRDVFLDAFPDCGGKQKVRTIFEADYITPHSTPLKNPIPIQFLKVKPQVRIRFCFKLNDGSIKAEKKKELFKQILLDVGIGAKTNVGYGQLAKESD